MYIKHDHQLPFVNQQDCHVCRGNKQQINNLDYGPAAL